MGTLVARKNLLKDLLAEPAPAATKPEAEPPALPGRPRAGGGAIGAVSRGIADLKARAVLELDPHLVDAGGLTDRLEHDKADHARLMASIRDYGQQVPVLVRPHPKTPGRYQIVYGRRRVLALRDLGQPVRALVRELDDHALILAQGQENTARRDLSFIEKANFARQMIEAGYERRIACDALSIDKTLLSRMLSVTDRVPVALIEAIGAAPGIGRDRWLAFADLIARHTLDPDDAGGIIGVSTAPLSPDSRFEALEAWLAARELTAVDSRPAPRSVPHETLTATDGRPLAELTRRRGALTLTLRSDGLDGFEDWLVTHLADIHARWREQRDGKS
jgi:ParB family transcriptional regulator, chromosome partitioning protein